VTGRDPAEGERVRIGKVGVSSVCVLVIGVGVPGGHGVSLLGAPPPTSPPPAPTGETLTTPDEVRAAVSQLAKVKDKRRKAGELRAACPPALLADALASAIASDPEFAADASVRAAAYEALGSVGVTRDKDVFLVTDPQIDRLLEGLKESDPQIRRTSAGALARVPDGRRPEVLAALTMALDDASVGVVQLALSAMGRMKVHQAAPEKVHRIAFGPTPEMRGNWSNERGSQELLVRMAAMDVIIAWESVEAVVDQDLAKDGIGRGARAVSVGRRALREHGRLDLDDRRFGVVISDMGDLLEEPTELRDVDRGAALALQAFGHTAKSEAVKKMARDRLKAASEAAPECKRELIRGVM
jgi:hypothetical protein